MSISPTELIKQKLPKRYAKSIADRLNVQSITPEQVRRVLNGEITNPDIYLPVIDAAMQLIEETEKINRRMKKLNLA